MITGLAAFAAANQAESRIQQSAPRRRLEKQLAEMLANRVEMAFETGPIRVIPDHKVPDLGRISLICLECAAIIGHQPLTVQCGLGSIQGR